MMNQIIKKTMIAFMLVTFSVAAFSQTESVDKQSKYGIYLGFNHSNSIYGDLRPAESFIENGLGFELGILADLQLTNWLSFSPKSELSFNNSNYHNQRGQEVAIQEIMPINVGFMGHLKVRKPNATLSPYVVFGPHYRLSLTSQQTVSSEFGTNNDFALDFGVGLEKAFMYFNFAPELRYSYGFNNVNQNPSIPLLYYHKISLTFNFLG